jgi:hypothetical protein
VGESSGWIEAGCSSAVVRDGREVRLLEPLGLVF